MYDSGKVLVSKKHNVYDLYHLDNLDEVLKGFEVDEIKNYKSEHFNEDFIEVLNLDLKILREIESNWNDVNLDPKLDALKSIIEKELTSQKIIIFTESKETASYLFEHLNNFYKNKVMVYSSDVRMISNQELSKSKAKDIIRKILTHHQKLNLMT